MKTLKMKMPNTILLAIAAFLATACYSDIDLSEYRDVEGENKLVLNSVVCPDSTIAVSASRLWYYEDKMPGNSFPKYVTGLDIRLTINGKAYRTLRYDEKKRLYTSDIKPNAGDEIEISTQFQGTEVSAHGIIPTPVELKSVNIRHEGIMNNGDNDYVITYSIEFQDDPNVSNYYFLNIQQPNFVITTNFDYTYEFVFAQLASHVTSGSTGWKPFSLYGLPFSDHGIEGKSHTLVVKAKLRQFNPSTIKELYGEFLHTVRLYSISEDYYNYQVSLLRAYGQDTGISGTIIDLGLASPTRIFSNINGGTGILGCYSTSSVTIDILSE